MKKLSQLFLITASLWVPLFPFETICFTGDAIVFAAQETGFQYPTSVYQETYDGQNGFPESNLSRLTPAQQYAGEILSYLLPVVLGQAGRLKSRKAWQTRGLFEELDFKNIVDVMTDVDKNELDLMVLDPDILDLTRVLYYYDNRLSLYKGDFGIASIYPAPEFVAIRLLLLQKIHRGEKVDLKGLIEREQKLFNQGVEPSPEDLKAMNLRPDELRLLRDLLEKEPHIYQYLKSPFLVKAFYKAGAIKGGQFIDQRIREASYKNYPCRYFGGSERIDAVKMLFLPSMIKELHYGVPHRGLSQHGFRPTEFFEKMAKKLKIAILAATKIGLEKEIVKLKKGRSKINGLDWDELVDQIVRENISFYIEDERPLVIYPDNAEQVIKDVGPEADFTVIILGGNVYRSIYFDRAKDMYPHVDRLYMDIMDIKHSEIQEDMEKISEFICLKLKDHLHRIIEER